MPDIRKQITAEIRKIQSEIDAQRRVIKHNTNKSLIIQEAEQQLQALNTRLGVLETNLEKCKPEGEPADHSINYCVLFGLMAWLLVIIWDVRFETYKLALYFKSLSIVSKKRL